MTRSKKLILLASVLVVLVIVTVVINVIQTNNEEAATEESEPVTFLTVDPEALTTLSWTCEDETVTLSYADGAWADADDAAFPVDAAYPDEMLAALAEVTASRSFTPEEDSEYGLDEPACTVQIDADTVTTLTIGNASELSGEYYASIGDGKVYLVDSDLVDAFSYGLSDILLMETIPDMTAMTGMDIATASGELNIAYLENSGYTYTDAYHWFMLESGSYLTLGGAADTLAEDIAAMSWLSCVNYNATEEDLATYGLDAPNATVILSYEAAAEETEETDETDETAEAEPETATFVFEIGGFTDGGYYARIQGSPMVYLLDSTLSQTILYANYEDLRPTDVCLLDWDTVTSFDIMLDGETYAFERGTTETTDDDGNVTEEEIFLMNGAEVDTDLVDDVLDAVYAMTATGTSEFVPVTAEIAFTFRRNTETFSEIDLTFYRADSESCVLSFNGETRLTVDRSDVVDLIETVNAILLE